MCLKKQMNNVLQNFIQQNSPDGGFLQSVEWKNFQESIGRKTYNISSQDFYANIIEHKLPVVERYFYIPRGPVMLNSDFRNSIFELIMLAKENKAGWIRIEPNDSKIIDLISENWRVVKAPHNMQPREVFIIDITKLEEQLLAEMKQKTRYNVKLAEKKGVKIFESQMENVDKSNNYINEFCRLTEVMAKRNGILAHPASYYQKMVETIPGSILKLYLAEYENQIIAANLVIFYGSTATYLHGASDDKYRNVMAPYLLQWQQIKDAKAAGCTRYDFGGIKTQISNFELRISKQYPNSNNQKTKQNQLNTQYPIPNTAWTGITKFKIGFSPNTKSIVFPGSYDIVIDTMRYNSYRLIQKIKSFL